MAWAVVLEVSCSARRHVSAVLRSEHCNRLGVSSALTTTPSTTWVSLQATGSRAQQLVADNSTATTTAVVTCNEPFMVEAIGRPLGVGRQRRLLHSLLPAFIHFLSMPYTLR
eukprot:m.201517 g.201517  ORF g.201517 m.201517 type:complete len:112 (-) comp18422_c0_seq2:174-509(-)